MKIVLVAGPPASGKTSVLKRTLVHLEDERHSFRLAKFDCIAGNDAELYRDVGVEPEMHLSGDLCPDHHLVVTIGETYLRACASGQHYLVIESAGLCDRCSPFLTGVPAVCVMGLTSNLHAPFRLRSMVGHADLVVLTKGELVSQAEREILRGVVREVNRSCEILEVNGLTGEGSVALAAWLRGIGDMELMEIERLRYPLPRGSCDLCDGGL